MSRISRSCGRSLPPVRLAARERRRSRWRRAPARARSPRCPDRCAVERRPPPRRRGTSRRRRGCRRPPPRWLRGTRRRPRCTRRQVVHEVVVPAIGSGTTRTTLVPSARGNLLAEDRVVRSSVRSCSTISASAARRAASRGQWSTTWCSARAPSRAGRSVPALRPRGRRGSRARAACTGSSGTVAPIADLFIVNVSSGRLTRPTHGR